MSGATSPRFTVVVPAFNSARTLRSTVESALAQTFSDFELIIVDDGSTDDTCSIARSFDDPRIRLVEQDHLGPSAARNAGTLAARAEFTCYLDSDDLLLPDYLAGFDRALRADPELDFVHTDTYTFDDRTRRVRRRSTAYYMKPPEPPPQTADELFRELLRANFIGVWVAVRTTAMIEAGLFDASLQASEDWEMWLRLSARGHRAVRVPGLHALRREHALSLSTDPMLMFGSHLQALEKVLREYDLSDCDRQAVELQIQAAQRQLDIVRGQNPIRSRLHRARFRLALARRRWGPSFQWHRKPPSAVAAAFPDLNRV